MDKEIKRVTWLWWCCDKKDHEVREKLPEILPEKSPVKFTPEGSPVKEKDTEKVVSDIIEKMGIDEDKDEEKGVKAVEENGKVESDGKGMTGDEKGVTNVEQEGMTDVDVQVHQTKGSEDKKCENKTKGLTSVGSDLHEGETGNEVATLCKEEEPEPEPGKVCDVLIGGAEKDIVNSSEEDDR